MTGRPGELAVEMNGGSTATYLMRAPCVPLFMLVVMGLETKALLDFQGWWKLRSVIFGVALVAAKGGLRNGKTKCRTWSSKIATL